MSTQPAQLSVPVWTFGDRIRKIRRETGLSQGAFAGRLGVTAPALGAWETGRNEPQDLVGVALAVEREFGIAASWLLGVEDGPRPDGGEGLRLRRARRDSNPQPSDPKVLPFLSALAA